MSANLLAAGRWADTLVTSDFNNMYKSHTRCRIELMTKADQMIAVDDITLCGLGTMTSAGLIIHVGTFKKSKPLEIVSVPTSVRLKWS